MVPLVSTTASTAGPRWFSTMQIKEKVKRERSDLVLAWENKKIIFLQRDVCTFELLVKDVNKHYTVLMRLSKVI